MSPLTRAKPKEPKHEPQSTDAPLAQGRASSGPGAPAPPSPRFRPAFHARLESARSGGSAVQAGVAQGAAMGARHGSARGGLPDRQDDPDFRARRAAPLRRHQYVSQGAL